MGLFEVGLLKMHEFIGFGYTSLSSEIHEFIGLLEVGVLKMHEFVGFRNIGLFKCSGIYGVIGSRLAENA